MRGLAMNSVLVLVVLGGCEAEAPDGSALPADTATEQDHVEYTPNRSPEQLHARAIELANGDDSNGQITLGRGYNVFGDYANPLDVTLPVLDYDALESAGLIDVFDANATQISTASGSSAEEYANTMAINAGLSGSFKNFSGSVETNFAKSTHGKLQNAYATLQLETLKRKVQLVDTDRALLQSFLSGQALADINNPDVSGATLIDKYGSHVVTGMYLGARLDYSMVTDMSAFDSSQSIDVAVEASFNSLFSSVSVGFDSSFEDELSQFEENSLTTLRVYGGDSEYTLGGLTEADYSEWLSSIEDNQVFVEYAGHEPLVPLWELVADPVRAAEIEGAYEAKSLGLSQIFEPDASTFEVRIEMVVTEPNDSGDNGFMEMYGEVSVEWDDVSATPVLQSETLFSRAASDYVELAEGVPFTPDEGPAVFQFVFDRDTSYIEITGELHERDESTSDEDYGEASVQLFVDDIIYDNEGVLTFSDGLGEVEVHYTVDILD